MPEPDISELVARGPGVLGSAGADDAGEVLPAPVAPAPMLPESAAPASTACACAALAKKNAAAIAATKRPFFALEFLIMKVL